MRVVVGMATFGPRESMARSTARTLEEQGAEVFLYDNSVRPDLTDNGKFHALSIATTTPCVYLTCDDDLYYPPDYVSRCVKEVMEHGCIITFHGRQLLGKGRGYYRGHKTYRCLREEKDLVEIDVPGTGVTAFHTDYFCPVGLHTWKDKKMSDLVFALSAARNDKRILHIPHELGWIKQKPVAMKDTIFGMESRKAFRQAEIADEIIDIKQERRPSLVACPVAVFPSS